VRGMLMADMKVTTVRAPAGFLEEARTELGFSSQQEMLLGLVRLALTQKRQREATLRILERTPDLVKYMDEDFRRRARR
jgi:hypothetical protein